MSLPKNNQTMRRQKNTTAVATKPFLKLVFKCNCEFPPERKICHPCQTRFLPPVTHPPQLLLRDAPHPPAPFLGLGCCSPLLSKSHSKNSSSLEQLSSPRTTACAESPESVSMGTSSASRDVLCLIQLFSICERKTQ